MVVVVVEFLLAREVSMRMHRYIAAYWKFPSVRFYALVNDEPPHSQYGTLVSVLWLHWGLEFEVPCWKKACEYVQGRSQARWRREN